MPNGNQATIDPAGVGQAVELAQHTQLLHAVLAELRSGVLDICVSDGFGQDMILDSFPVAGAKRVLAYRTGNGFDSLAVPTAPGVLVLPANKARLGCQLVNSGANAIILYLSDQRRAGVPAIWLAANGGSWDGRFAQVAWGGNITAVAQTGPSTLIGGEV